MRCPSRTLPPGTSKPFPRCWSQSRVPTEKSVSLPSQAQRQEEHEQAARLIMRNEAPGLGAWRAWGPGGPGGAGAPVPQQEAGPAPWKGASKLPFLPSPCRIVSLKSR